MTGEILYRTESYWGGTPTVISVLVAAAGSKATVVDGAGTKTIDIVESVVAAIVGLLDESQNEVCGGAGTTVEAVDYLSWRIEQNGATSSGSVEIPGRMSLSPSLNSAVVRLLDACGLLDACDGRGAKGVSGPRFARRRRGK